MEEEIIERCPNCGCAVAGQLPEKEQWKEIGKGFLGGLVGAYVGSTYGNEYNADDLADSVAIGTYSLLSAGGKKHVYEFSCPNCGYRWRSHGVGGFNQNAQLGYTNNNVPDNSADNETQYFVDEFNRFFESEDAVLQTKEALNNYLNSIEGVIRDSLTNDVVKSEFRFLQAFACSEYLYYIDCDDNGYSRYGEQAIDSAMRYYNDDEYKVLKLILKSYNLPFDSYNILSIQDSYDKQCPNISNLQNTLIKNEYLQQVYNFSRFISLFTTALKLDERGSYKQALDCLELMLKLDTPLSVITATSHLRYCYSVEERYKSFWNEDKAFYYAKLGADHAMDYMKSNYNPEDKICKEWMTLVEQTALGYKEGKGVNANYNEAERYFLIGAGYGSENCKNSLKELFTPSLSVGNAAKSDAKNETAYIEELKECLRNGVVSERERRLLEKLRVKLGISEERAKEFEKTLLGSDADAEKEYLETYKECLLEDGEITAKERRLLDKLRIKLGISEERAKELEVSVNDPVLTTEEQDYIESYKEALVDGTLSDKERRLLEKLRVMYGISEERARELEIM